MILNYITRNLSALKAKLGERAALEAAEDAERQRQNSGRRTLWRLKYDVSGMSFAPWGAAYHRRTWAAIKRLTVEQVERQLAKYPPEEQRMSEWERIEWKKIPPDERAAWLLKRPWLTKIPE